MDNRHKLTRLDYQKIAFDDSQGLTIRQVANNWNISTKYVTRILDRVHGVAPTETTIHACYGCGYSFASASGLSLHQEIWTSGNTHELSCYAMVR
jgi:AraC-like DNA-binding protein